MTDQEKLSALFTGGFLVIFILFVLMAMAIAVTVWGLLYRKAGYSFWLGLVMVVPLANLAMLIWFLVAKWPIQQELERLRALQGQTSLPPQAAITSA